MTELHMYINLYDRMMAIFVIISINYQFKNECQFTHVKFNVIIILLCILYGVIYDH